MTYAILIDRNVIRLDNVSNPCLVWGEWFGSNERQIALDAVTVPGYGKVQVSTVFLGINHQLFETMVFLESSSHLFSPQELYTNRYSTYDEAEEGHERAVRAVFASIYAETVEDIAL